MDNKNLRIWDSVSTTDPAHVKPPAKGMNGLSSLSAYYIFQQATKTFGPCGIGWGYEELGEDYRLGEPIEVSGSETAHVINHIVRIKLWYMLDGQRGEIPSIGSTKYLSKNKWGLTSDEEVAKKSLTDAIKKALSMLGFCADVYMGKFDDKDYIEGAKIKIAVEKETERELAAKAEYEKVKEYVNAQIVSTHSMTNPEQARKALERVKQKTIVRCATAGFTSKGFETLIESEKEKCNAK